MHRILIIDDNESIHDDYRKILAPRTASASLNQAKAALFGPPASTESSAQPRFEIHSAHQGQAGFETLSEAVKAGRPFAMAFVDMRMPPGWDGLRTIENLWAMDPALQIVICSAYSDHSWEDLTHRLGLTDRLLILKKPFDPIEVLQIAAAMCEKWSLKQLASLKMDELERIVEQRTRSLAHAALHDGLTGLPNRMQMREALTRVLADRDAATPFALLFLDFDRFKVINDTLGHDAGDKFLVEIAARLQAAVTEDCGAWSASIAARHGGDEFMVLITGDGAERAAFSFGNSLLTRLSVPFSLKGFNLTTTASIGITTSGRRYTTADEAIRDADTAMYHAKAGGKNRCIMFDQRMHDQLAERVAMEADLRGIAERGELVLNYQPIVMLENRTLHGFEALVRWNHPTKGAIDPDQFIHAAEETGEILSIGRWVLHTACDQLARWRREVPACGNLHISVNISAKQLSTNCLVGDVQSALAASGLPPASLAVEITESAIIEDPAFAIGILKELSDLGVRVHMDDFGTGYTSFSYLHRLPINALKLDRSFMSSVKERREYAAVIHAIVNLAHNLNITVVAEGVETPAQVASLLAIECDFGQGYLFGRALSTQAATEMLLNPPGIQAAA